MKFYRKSSSVVVLLCLLTISCKKKSYKIVEDNKGGIEELIINNDAGTKTVYSYYKNGQIKLIERYDSIGKLQEEKLWFYPSGTLKQKVSFSKDIANGSAYYFYDTIGTIKNTRYYRNDKEVLYGADYWGDSINVIKASLHFNDSGQIYYKKNFDKNGKLISEEGERE